MPPRRSHPVPRPASPRIAALALAVTSCGPTAPVPTDTDPTTTATTDDDPTSPATNPSHSDEDAPGDPTDAPHWDLPPAPDSSGGEDTGADPIECLEFDPARVYLLGTLEQGATYLDAITDPTDPTSFCVGFVSAGWATIRTADRRVVFVDAIEGGGVLEFTPDPIGVDLKGHWIYPDDPYANDELLFPLACGGTGPGPILLSPVDGRVWSSCDGTWFDPEGVPAWTSPDATGVAIAPDGRLLVNDTSLGSELYLVTPGARPESSLELPRDVEAVVTGRVHDDGLWLVALDGLRLFRWHLVGDTIVEEGEYSDADADIFGTNAYDGVLDGAGDYFHLATQPGDGTNDYIMRRRLAPEASEIIYEEATADPFAVKVYLSELFTGP